MDYHGSVCDRVVAFLVHHRHASVSPFYFIYKTCFGGGAYHAGTQKCECEHTCTCMHTTAKP